jgi:hypothetical protein
MSRGSASAPSLPRPFGNYRNPDPSQATNFCLNDAFQVALSGGARISVAIVMEVASLSNAGDPLEPDLGIKAIRRFAENAAIRAEDVDAVTLLNR